MKVSIFDVAKKSGLSIVTVSRVINNSQTVREKNRQKVLQAMKELDYHPNAAARSLARGKTGIIGLIMTTLNDAFLDEVVKEITLRLESSGYYLALSVSTGMNADNVHYLIQEDRVDGLILLSPISEESYVLELEKRNIPFVLIDNQNPQTAAPSVVVDNFQGGYAAARHLLELGHRKIAHVGGSEIFLSSRERKRGFLQALKEHHLSPFYLDLGQFQISFGYETAKAWIEQNRLPTAVFAGDDYIGIGIINACSEYGIRVPHQLSVVGYDDQSIASELRPHLTTIRQPTGQIAAQAVEILLKQINRSSRRNTTIALQPQLIVRESTMRCGN